MDCHKDADLVLLNQPQNLRWLVRVKQHPNRQPRRAEAVNGGNDDDRDAD